MRKKRKFNRNTPQSTPTSPISMSDALADAVEAIDFVLRNENVDITVPASDVAWLRLIKL